MTRVTSNMAIVYFSMTRVTLSMARVALNMARIILGLVFDMTFDSVNRFAENSPLWRIKKILIIFRKGLF